MDRNGTRKSTIDESKAGEMNLKFKEAGEMNVKFKEVLVDRLE
jgi:hypothetical protein